MSKRLIRKATQVAAALGLLWAVFASTQVVKAASTHTPWRNLSLSQMTAVW